MTGISGIALYARSVRRSLLSRILMLFPSAILIILKDYLPLYGPEIGTMPKPNLGYFEEKSEACNPFRHVTESHESRIWPAVKSTDFLNKVEAKGGRGHNLRSLNPAKIEGTNLNHLISARREALLGQAALGKCRK